MVQLVLFDVDALGPPGPTRRPKLRVVHGRTECVGQLALEFLPHGVVEWWPLSALISATGMTPRTLRARLGYRYSDWARYSERGLSWAQADRLALLLGFWHPSAVWPEWGRSIPVETWREMMADEQMQLVA